MNTDERTYARKLFKLLIHESEGQAFEDVFTQVMKYACPEFRSIRPYGNVGDRKNDGYIQSEGTYFQVYAPEDIRNTRTSVNAVRKLRTDFTGLRAQWHGIRNFVFVINDKFKGAPPDCELEIQEIKEQYMLENAEILTASDLENIMFSLEDDKIKIIIGFLPDPANLKELDYSIVAEVIGYILQQPMQDDNECAIIYPDWEEKIHFNGLSKATAIRLNNGIINIKSLEDFLSNDYGVADILRDKINEVYLEEKKSLCQDELFWAIVNRLSPRPQRIYKEIVIVIMAKYFESCDIFETPIKEAEK